MIDLRRLQVLRAVEQCGSVTAAAHALHLSPSAVSQQLRTLARELGVELLAPNGRGVQLTPAAGRALEHAHRLYQQWEHAAADIRAHAGDAPARLRMCGFPSALSTLLCPTATVLANQDPPVQVELREAETPECFERLLTEQADLALIVPNAESPPLDDPRFDQRPLLDDVFDLLVPAGHPLAQRDEVNLADAALDTWIVAVPAHTEQHNQTLAACAAAGFAPRIGHYATDWGTVAALVAANHGVKLLPRLVTFPDHPGLRRIALAGQPRPSRRILIAARRGSHDQPALDQAVQALQDLTAAHLG